MSESKHLDESNSLAPIENLDVTGDPAMSSKLDDGVQLKDSQKLLGHRYALTLQLLWMTVVLAVSLIGLAALVAEGTWSRVSEVASLVFVPFTTLLGTAMGWYFSGGGRPDAS